MTLLGLNAKHRRSRFDDLLSYLLRFQRFNSHIQLKANQQKKGIQEDQEHEHHDRAYRAVEAVEVIKMIDPQGKKAGHQGNQDSGQDRTRG